jgi:predicted small integral membrane protein
MALSWMAWIWKAAVSFTFMLVVLVIMGVWEWRRSGGDPRRGILGLDTTRGDRLFLSLLGKGFITMAWLYFFDTPPYGALA